MTNRFLLVTYLADDFGFYSLSTTVIRFPCKWVADNWHIQLHWLRLWVDLVADASLCFSQSHLNFRARVKERKLTSPHLLPSASPLRITAECLGDTALLIFCREVNLLISSASWINSTSKFGSWPRVEPWSLENDAQIHGHSEEEKGWSWPSRAQMPPISCIISLGRGWNNLILGKS